MASKDFTPFYPDVLGAVTRGPRINMDKLQVALGIFPQRVFINQPFEALIVLQNMVDKALQVKVAIQLPKTDKQGNKCNIETPRSQFNIQLGPGEVGILRAPVVARRPTRPGKDFPMRVAVRYRGPNRAEYVRPKTGGAPPSVLTISPFKLQVLHDVAFNAHTWNESAEIITAYFELTQQRVTDVLQVPKPSYEKLWEQENMAEEITLAKAQLANARKLADSALHGSSFDMFKILVDERFSMANYPLHPGETMAIAKMMAYTVDEAPTYEPHTNFEQTRWFLALCQVLANDPGLYDRLERHELIADRVFNEVLYESILMAFKILRTKIDDDLGSDQEKLAYANRVVEWLEGREAPDLNYVYMPLVLGGLAVSRLVPTTAYESPWEIVDSLREALNGRMRLAHEGHIIVFEMLKKLLDEEEDLLTRQRIPR